MKAVLTKASNWRFEEIIEINTLEDLIKLKEKYNCPIIFQDNFFYKLSDTMSSSKEKETCPYELLIYDDYIE